MKPRYLLITESVDCGQEDYKPYQGVSKATTFRDGMKSKKEQDARGCNMSYPYHYILRKVFPSKWTLRMEALSAIVCRSSINELKKRKRIPLVIYHILEDANHHTLNSVLTKEGFFGEYLTGKEYHSTRKYYVPRRYSWGNKKFKQYRMNGGTTWE